MDPTEKEGQSDSTALPQRSLQPVGMREGWAGTDHSTSRIGGRPFGLLFIFKCVILALLLNHIQFRFVFVPANTVHGVDFVPVCLFVQSEHVPFSEVVHGSRCP